MIGKLAAFQIQNLIVAYKERFDKDSFIKNLLLDNLLLVDIYNRAKKLHIDTEARRVVFLLETDHEKDNSSLESVRTVLGSKNGDFITAVDEKSIIVVKEVGEQEDYSDMERIAHQILEALEPAKREYAYVAYGTIVEEIKNLLQREKRYRLQLSGNRPSDLSAAHSAVQDVYPRDLRRQVTR